MKFLHTFFYKKYFLMIGTLVLVFSLIVCINIFNYLKTKTLLKKVTDTNMSMVLENSARGRTLSELFYDINTLRRSFLGNDNFLESEKIRLDYELSIIIDDSKNENLNATLIEIRTIFDSFLVNCMKLNSLYNNTKHAHTNIQNKLDTLEFFIGQILIEQTLEEKDTSFIEQLLMLVVGYQGSLLEIEKMRSELGAEHLFNQEEIDPHRLTGLIEDLILRLQTITASIPIIAESGSEILIEVRRYNDLVDEYFNNLVFLEEQSTILDFVQNKLLFEMRNIDNTISFAHQDLNTKIIKTIFISSCSVLALTLLVLILQGTINISLFKKMNTEIDHRKHVENELRKSESQLKAFSDASFEAIFLSDKGICQAQNQTAEKMFGFTDEEALGKHGTEWIAVEDRDTVAQNIIAGTEKAYRANALRKDGTVFPCEVQTRTMNFHGKSTRATALRDITNLQRAQEEKENALRLASEAHKLAFTGKMAGKMAHDFNNVLTIIMGMAELTLVDTKEDKTRKALQLIFEQTIRGKNLTKNLVTYAKDQEIKQNHFNVNEKIDLIIDLLEKDLLGIEVTKQANTEIPELFADPGMIEHALVNLLQNSVHALSFSNDPKIQITTDCRENKICIEILDNGCGIPKEHHKDIFDPSFTLKGSMDVTGSYTSDIKGTGYGMANVKKYIDLHKGDITIESDTGSGTKIAIFLPTIKKSLTSEEIVVLQKERIYSEKRILLVEDEIPIANIQSRVLTQPPCNHKVDKAPSGQIAMDLIDSNEYDLISLDYMLPDNINGMDIYQHVRAKNKKIPILFISGNIEFLESIHSLRQKDNKVHHISKPCQNKEYVQSINTLFDKALG